MNLPISETAAPRTSLPNPSTDDARSIDGEGLVDRFGRVHTSLRVSVTDRCNIRCRYCMPADDVEFMPSSRWLAFDLVARLVQLLAHHGVRKVRITGGEPLLRPRLQELIQLLSRIQGIDDIALTTNGILLAESAAELHQAGLRRVNISLDTLQEANFFAISRRKGLEKVFAGIAAAQREGLDVRLNAMLLRGINSDEAIPLVQFAQERGLAIRFIEFMPLDADRQWNASTMVSGAELRAKIGQSIGKLLPIEREDQSQPASDYRLESGNGIVGFIDSVSQPFCSSCNRLRLTADGQLRNCLFGRTGWDIGGLLREGASDSVLLDTIKDCVRNKHAAHGISERGFEPPPLAMYQIGG